MNLNASTILIVDDDLDLRQELKEAFEDFGAKVIEAENGIKALELYKSAPEIKAIISDLRMSGGDGIELLQNLKSLKSQTPFFLITGFTDYTGKELKVLGASAVIFKPFDVEELVDMVGQKIS